MTKNVIYFGVKWEEGNSIFRKLLKLIGVEKLAQIMHSVRLLKKTTGGEIMNTYNQQRGFSLIELMLVISVLGILAGIAIPSYFNHVTKSQLVGTFEILRNFRTQIQAEVAVNGRLPLKLEGLEGFGGIPKGNGGIVCSGYVNRMAYFGEHPDHGPYVGVSHYKDGAQNCNGETVTVPKEISGKLVSYAISLGGNGKVHWRPHDFHYSNNPAALRPSYFP